MERLTHRIGNNPAVPTKFDLDFAFKTFDDDQAWAGLTAIFDRLAAYEDTGLEPAAIVEMNDFTKSQCVILLGELDETRNENAQLRVIVEHIDPDFFRRKCRVCGCNWNHPCEGGCSWVGDDLCSKCFGKMLRSESNSK